MNKQTQVGVSCIEHGTGKLVRIQWAEEKGCFEADGDPDRWHHFKIIGEWRSMRMLLLKGVDEGNAKFSGDPFWIPVEKIYLMEVLSANK